MRREIDRQLLVHPTCLMFFCDDTGHEDFRDRNYPVFGIGGCGIMAGAIEPVLKQPWRAMKAEHFGGPDVPLHASKLSRPTQSQLDAPIHRGIMPKWAGDEALEVHAAGTQARNWDTGDKRFRRDFQAVFHANALWSSFNAIASVH
jgi:hypothetical protein